MDNIQRNTNPVRTINQVGVQPKPVHTTHTGGPRPSSSKSKKPFLIVAIVLIALLALGSVWYFFGRGPAAGAIDSNKYQAVFFTNGQVYFGKLSAVNGDYMRLKNVYYLQNKTESTDEASPQSASAQDASDVELIKLGNEIHGPEDEMLVSKDQILFFENLKPAGTVSQTITNFQKSKE